MSKLLINPNASVIPYQIVRHALYLLGYGATRKNDSKLDVYENPINSGLWVPPNNENYKVVSYFSIDEGLFTDTMRPDGTIGLNKPWDELCDMNNLLKLMVRRLNKDWRPKSSPYMGRGFTWNHYNKEYQKALSEFMPGTKMESCIEFTSLIANEEEEV